MESGDRVLRCTENGIWKGSALCRKYAKDYIMIGKLCIYIAGTMVVFGGKCIILSKFDKPES